MYPNSQGKQRGETNTLSDYEDGQFPSSGDEDGEYNDNGNFGGRSKLEKFRFVARLPAYSRINPNLPSSSSNRKLSIVRGIETRLSDR